MSNKANSLYKNDNPSEEFIKVKHHGKIYTPDYLVEIILDQGNYKSDNILKKHVIDNSCGDGQFMIRVVDRYCKNFLNNSQDLLQLKKELEEFIHAIEIDGDELQVCIERCNKVAALYGVTDIKWDFRNEDTLKCTEFDNKMDFVVGNPPYVRVHNLNESFDSVKSYLFGNGGMTDLYIVFYEIGIKMLNKTGILSYITPSSFFTSVAGNNMRHYLIDNQILESVCDLKHFQPFNAITYTTIICINKKHKSNQVTYYEFDEEKLKPFVVAGLELNDYFINENFYFSTKNNLSVLKKIIFNMRKSDIAVKNGYATLADKVFISNFDFDSKFIIPVVKASRALWTKIFYPYDKNGKIISEEELKKDEKMYAYLLSMKNQLVERDNENDGDKFWYAFGRSQGLNDTYKDKVSINALIRESKDLKIVDVPAGSGVYSGLYIISGSISIDEIKEALLDEEFGTYIRLLGKYKSGGYYTFSSKDVKIYLDYKLGDGGLFDYVK